LRPLEIALQSLQYMPTPAGYSDIQFFEHNGAQPERRVGGQPFQRQGCFVSGAKCRNVDRRVKENRMHLLFQSSIGIRNINATCDEALVGFGRQSVSLMLSDNDVESPLDCLCFRIGAQHPLCASEFSCVQLEMFM